MWLSEIARLQITLAVHTSVCRQVFWRASRAHRRVLIVKSSYEFAKWLSSSSRREHVYNRVKRQRRSKKNLAVASSSLVRRSLSQYQWELVAVFGGVRHCSSSLRATSRELITAPERQIVRVQEKARSHVKTAVAAPGGSSSSHQEARSVSSSPTHGRVRKTFVKASALHQSVVEAWVDVRSLSCGKSPSSRLSSLVVVSRTCRRHRRFTESKGDGLRLMEQRQRGIVVAAPDS